MKTMFRKKEIKVRKNSEDSNLLNIRASQGDMSGQNSADLANVKNSFAGSLGQAQKDGSALG